MRKPFRRAVTAAPLDPDQILRHTLLPKAITHLALAGVHLPTVQRMSGHKALAMIERYAHATAHTLKSRWTNCKPGSVRQDHGVGIEQQRAPHYLASHNRARASTGYLGSDAGLPEAANNPAA